MPKLVVGCGYLGSRVAGLWGQTGETIHVITRSIERANAFSARGWSPIVVDLTQPESLTKLPDIDTVLFAVGYERPRMAGLSNSTAAEKSSRPDSHPTALKSIFDVYAGGLANVLRALPATVGRIIYISSTGVYGQTDGEWVTEDSPCSPTREGGKASLAAEDVLRAHPLGGRSIVLRLAGIYGPGRIPRRDDLLAGRPIPAPSEGWLNLIHVDDAARIVLAVEKQATPSAMYLVSDGTPVPRRDYYAELANLLGAPEPHFEPAPADSPAAQRATADKKISNSKLRREVAISLSYPSYREGLASIVQSWRE